MNNNKINVIYLIDSTLNSLLDSDNRSDNSKEFLKEDYSNIREKSEYGLKHNNVKCNKDYFKSSSYVIILIDGYNVILYPCICSKENKKISPYYKVIQACKDYLLDKIKQVFINRNKRNNYIRICIGNCYSSNMLSLFITNASNFINKNILLKPPRYKDALKLCALKKDLVNACST